MTMPRSTPSEQGVDARRLLALLDAFEQPGHGLHSLMIARNGHVIAEGWWAPYAPERVHLGYSLSKSFTATTLGMLAGQGRIDLDAPVLAGLTDLAAVAPVWREVTVRHCITMTTGHSAEAWSWTGDALPPVAAADEPDALLPLLLAKPPDGRPGEVWAYNQVATYLVAQAVLAATGEPLTTHVRRLLLDPLGGGPARAQRTPQGRDLGFSGLHITTETILALAQLWLDGGRWQGEQLVPADYAELAATATPASLLADEVGDWAHGYGHSFWGASHGFRGDGAFGQYAIVLPEHRTAVAITSEVAVMQDVLDALWRHLLPALDGAPDEAADRTLKDRTGRLRHEPPAPGGGRRPAQAIRHPQSQLPPTFAAARLQPTDDGHLLVLEHAEGDLETPIGDGRWLECRWPTRWGPDVAVAAAGGWSGGRFRAELRMVETPHTVEVILDPQAGDVRLDWRLVPLTGADPLNLASHPF